VVTTSAHRVSSRRNRTGVTLPQHLGTIQAVLVVPNRLDVPTLVSTDTVLCIRRNTVAYEPASCARISPYRVALKLFSFDVTVQRSEIEDDAQCRVNAAHLTEN
jgi:hypothetical protein